MSQTKQEVDLSLKAAEWRAAIKARDARKAEAEARVEALAVEAKTKRVKSLTDAILAAVDAAIHQESDTAEIDWVNDPNFTEEVTRRNVSKNAETVVRLNHLNGDDSVYGQVLRFLDQLNAELVIRRNFQMSGQPYTIKIRLRQE